MKLFFHALILASIGFLPVAGNTAEVDPVSVAEDCRAEGEGEGLAGPVLDEFVKQCIMTLLEELDLSETAAGPPSGE